MKGIHRNEPHKTIVLKIIKLLLSYKKQFFVPY